MATDQVLIVNVTYQDIERNIIEKLQANGEPTHPRN